MKIKFAEYRKIRGFTQEYMAEQLSVSLRTYSNFERNVTEPSLDILVNISKILKTPIDDLLDNEIYPSSRDKIKEKLIEDINNVLEKYK